MLFDTIGTDINETENHPFCYIFWNYVSFAMKPESKTGVFLLTVKDYMIYMINSLFTEQSPHLTRHISQEIFLKAVFRVSGKELICPERLSARMPDDCPEFHF